MKIERKDENILINFKKCIDNYKEDDIIKP